MIVHDPRYLLLLSCGERKRDQSGVLPAIQRYDGPVWRDLRSMVVSGYRLPKILILSAEYGLIEPETEIANYNRLMTAERGDEIARSPEYRDLFRLHFAQAESVLSVAGAKYESVYRQWLMPNESYAHERRGIGWKRKTMGEFVRGIPKEGHRP